MRRWQGEHGGDGGGNEVSSAGGGPATGQAGQGGPVHDGVDVIAGGTLLCEAWLCPQLLRKWREHAQIGKIFDVIVAGPLGWISGHGQHVLWERGKERRGVGSALILPGSGMSQEPSLPATLTASLRQGSLGTHTLLAAPTI